MLVRPQATERRARTDCALALNKIVSDMMRAAATLTRVAAHVQNPDKSTSRALALLRRYTNRNGWLCIEDVESVARALERGRSPKVGAKRRKRKPNHNDSADVVSLSPDGAPVTAPPESDAATVTRRNKAAFAFVDDVFAMLLRLDQGLPICGAPRAMKTAREFIGLLSPEPDAPDDGPIPG